MKKKLFWSSEVSRNLSHSLSKVESGVEVTSGKRTSSYKGMPVFRGEGQAPPGVKDIALEYSSVYKRDKPALRSITDREMMEVYYVKNPTQQNLEGFWAKNKVTASRSFCHAAPAKLLCSAARAALLVSGSVTILGLGVDSCTDEQKAARVKVESFDPATAPKFGYEENLDGVAGSSRKQDGGTGGSKPDVKAAKNDDAEVDSSQWDLWCVDHFDSTSITGTPLVCVAGTFDESRHGLCSLP